MDREKEIRNSVEVLARVNDVASEVYQLGKQAGRFESMTAFSKFMQITAVCELEKMLAEKTYRKFPNPETGRPYDLDSYCAQELKMSRQTVTTLVAAKQQYGMEFIQIAGEAGVSVRKVQGLLAASQEERLRVQEITENTPAEQQVELLKELLGEVKARAAREKDVYEERSARQAADLEKRKKDGVKWEDERRNLERQLREAKGFVLPEDVQEAQQEISKLESGIALALRQIGDIAVAHVAEDLVCKRTLGAANTLLEWIDDLRERLSVARTGWQAEHRDEE